MRPTGKTGKISPLTNQPNENNDFNYIPRSRPIIGWIQYRISFIPIDQRECITKFNRTVWYWQSVCEQGWRLTKSIHMGHENWILLNYWRNIMKCYLNPKMHLFSYRFFDKKYELVTVEYPLCSGDIIHICKITFADWVLSVSLNAYFSTYYW